MSTIVARLHYRYSKAWLVFWLLVFFPVAVVLLVTGAEAVYNGQYLSIRYDGSRFWLCFWTVVFFPAAFLLFFLNGMALVRD